MSDNMDAQPDRFLADANTRLLADLDQVLDVEAGLAEVLSIAAAEDAQRAAFTINDGLANLFLRLGPPDHETEK
ncbi:hypothetical protein ACWY4P_54045 (plasmid) [Streptomyces sp. LZ34]